MKVVLICLLIVLSCKTPNVHWTEKGTQISYDTVRVQTYKDSGRLDTITYRKHVYYNQKSPRTINGKWYVITGLIIAVCLALFLRN